MLPVYQYTICQYTMYSVGESVNKRELILYATGCAARYRVDKNKYYPAGGRLYVR